MAKNVMVTGTGRHYALGFNLVLRYLENGDNVIATVRKESEELTALKSKYNEQLHIVTMDIGNTESVNNAFTTVSKVFDRIDLLINNAVTTSQDVEKDFFDFNLDYVADVVDVTAVGPLRVIQKFFPLLENTDDMSLIINISSEAGSISKCYRKFYVDYGMAKAALNMGTMTIWNNIKDNDKVNIFAIHPGWIKTNGKEDNPAPLSAYDAAEILRNLFEKRRYDKKGHRFITNEGVDYPF